MATARDADVRLLRAWRAVEGRVLPAWALAEAAGGLSAPELAARIAGLRGAGYVIEGSSGSEGGYHLVAAPARLIADDLRAARPDDAVVGREILVFEETDSTNDLAARAGQDGVPEGLVIFAESQRAGRGRLGRRWVSPPGMNLLFSILLRPEAVPVERWPELTFCAALAVAETAEQHTGQPARIKWPNDVLLSGRKVAGILLESHRGQTPGFVVVGIGLNVLQQATDFPPELRDRAGSLAMMRPTISHVRREVAAFVLARLESHYADWPDHFASIREECARRGCASPPEGAVVGVNR